MTARPWFCFAVGLAVSLSAALSVRGEAIRAALRVSENHHYVVNADTGAPVFLLADTAWNLGALRLDEVDLYIRSREKAGFNVVMFALNFSPQAEEKNAEGQAAYIGADHSELNAAYFSYCDEVVHRCADRGLYVMIYTMWAGRTSGTMNQYTAAQLERLGQAIGRHFAGVKSVILCVGGESTPHYIDAEHGDALGRGLKAGCAGRNLVTVHPVGGTSASRTFAAAPWLDFFLCQAKSGTGAQNAAYDAAALVAADFARVPAKPTMMGEHRYETGVDEDPIIQRRSLYQCVFAGAFGHAYGHDALWQMTPHTAQPWMLKGWNPGVKDWKDALATPAVRQLRYIVPLLMAHPYLERIPDQELVLSGQGADVATRVQATRDGTAGRKDASYIFAYISSPQPVTLDTSVIGARTLDGYWFDPATGRNESMGSEWNNIGSVALSKRAAGADWVAVIENADRHYARPQ